jgi:hypothetical protein
MRRLSAPHCFFSVENEFSLTLSLITCMALRMWNARHALRQEEDWTSSSYCKTCSAHVESPGCQEDMRARTFADSYEC